MAMYYCKECDNYVDDDHNPGLPHKGELICPSCAEDVQHGFKTDGNPEGNRMCAYCDCGWSSVVLNGQSQEHHRAARVLWENHVAEYHVAEYYEAEYYGQ